MFTLMIVVFIVGYLCIALEHPLKINKSATALILGVLLWVFAVLGGDSQLVNSTSLLEYTMNNPGTRFMDWLVHSQLIGALGEVSEILFFLLGAMTIVELIDTQGGFRVITDKIRTTNKVKLLWAISILAFFMSAVLDNLTTSIVMVALLRKLIDDRKDRWFYAGMVIVAANAGGAWSPIGDVTTIMLWIAGKISAINVIKMTFLASLASLLVPLGILSFTMKGNVSRPTLEKSCDVADESCKDYSTLFLVLGVSLLLFVPVFKTITHLPPYLGMLGALGVLWIVSEILHRNDSEEIREKYAISTVLKKVDIQSILFFLGILLAVSALSTVGHLDLLSQKLSTIPLEEPQKYYVINIIIGMLSSIVDNVPLVAGAMGMYNFCMDHYFWEFLAYCAGTGGSILIIGSAAGVAVMGMEKIDFIWYLKKISWLALVGYLAGAFVFIGQKSIQNYMLKNNPSPCSEVPLTKEGVTDYLLKHTFYLIEEDQSLQTKDSTAIKFIDFKDKKTEYKGLNVRTYHSENDRIIFFNNESSLLFEDFELEVLDSDTVAYINYGGQELFVTKSGEVFLVSGKESFIPLIKSE